MDWESYKKENIVKEAKVDLNLINSLIKSSSKKFSTQKILELTEETASSKITLAYDSLGELLEALSISKGYKVYNHGAYCAFLKEILKDSELGDKFNNIRKIRNAINYYGKDISKQETEHIISEISELIKKIRTILST
ncbi:hypothetical protein COV15_01790 [Candidatus Woesearchaeota archaeon CG10_big_fil_rev_8_21_14_0_10_34_12]|nr:MAG: hypothetical protein COV15_01790 [Candidatus Woesearchaeota archaeon CG10_big_fil_rev_8_21_14_0_10_34_12]